MYHVLTMHVGRLVKNAFWEFRGFCVYTQTLPDSLHLADVGLFAGILFAIFKNCREYIFDWLDNAEKRWETAMERLEFRLKHCTFIGTEKLPDAVCQVGMRITKSQNTTKSSPLFKASEFRRLMLVTCRDDAS